MQSHKPRKAFGQNFLCDQGIIQRIIQVIDPKPGDNLIEIGPGQGALTWPVLAMTGALTAIEIDRDLIKRLKIDATKHQGHFHLHEGDALTVDLSTLASSGGSLRLIGNLPYNISTPLIFHALSFIDLIKDMTFMLQKEVVMRMAASPGNKTYGRLSVMVQYYCEVTSLLDVPPESFYPQPKVDSAIVRLEPLRPRPFVAVNEIHFAHFVNQAFMHRRKTLSNSLKRELNGRSLEDYGFYPSIRAEQLSVGDFVRLSNALANE